MRLIFDWDEKKNALNKKAHGISFEVAARVFYDPLCKCEPDNAHNDSEERFITAGYISQHSCIMVVHTTQELDDDCTLIRIISARKLDKSERKRHENDL